MSGLVQLVSLDTGQVVPEHVVDFLADYRAGFSEARDGVTDRNPWACEPLCPRNVVQDHPGREDPERGDDLPEDLPADERLRGLKLLLGGRAAAASRHFRRSYTRD